ncbi:hypothetical protein WH47_06291 [Habropoda laboriosa]|uniref:Uncharacterized protein n=1 Tax=Habropoda laboriosa TaxID=597456 RepID=A0A0L7QJ31_9HYME|nr:hypothetical protein WH47_06291 [Habropoda laboriosa]
MRSNPVAMSGEHSGVKKKRRSRRGGKKVQERRQKAIARDSVAAIAQKLAYVAAPTPRDVQSIPEPELIDLCDDSDEETVIIPRPPTPVEILDTRTALRVNNHENIPDSILRSYIRNYSNDTPSEVPQDIAWWSKTEAAAMQQALAEEDLALYAEADRN